MVTAAQHLVPALALAAALLGAGCGQSGTDWGLEAIRTMRTPPDPPLTCGQALPADQNAAARAACTFGAGARASASLGVGTTTLTSIPIRHVIVAMKENRTFDHLLGHLHDRGQPGVEAIPASWQNPDAQGVPVFPGPASTTCVGADPGHTQSAMQACIDGGRMDGFVRSAAGTTATDGRFVMSNYDAPDLPFYYWLARTFAVGDRDFSAVAGPTHPNRGFLLFGTDIGTAGTPPSDLPSILQLLMNAGYTWGVYTDGAPFSGILGWTASDPGVHPLHDLYDALDAGTLPSVAFVDAREGVDDDHPIADLQAGEAWLKALYDHVVTSPQASRLALIWTYDEGGGFADHVPPEQAACATATDGSWTARGPRVPLVVVSPWARRAYVSHVARDHLAVTRFIEAIFDLPALTRRDANSDALLDLFDFSCGRDLALPAGPAPGTGGCVR